MAGFDGQIMVPSDPNADVRVRRFMQGVADVLNSLLRSGQVNRLSLGEYTIALNLAVNSGLTFDGNGAITIDLNSSLLNITGNGLGLTNQTGNTFLASPAGGGNGPPAFRLLVAGDIPPLACQPLATGLTSLAAANTANSIYYHVGSGVWAPVLIGGNLTLSNGTISAAIAATGVARIGNGTANATANVTLVAGNNVQVSITGNTVTVSVTATPGNGSPPSGGLDPNTSIYPTFTVTGGDDEFDNGVFSDWTEVGSGNVSTTITETNNVLSILHPGGGNTAELVSWVKSQSISNGTTIEVALRGIGRPQNFNVCGLMMSNGTTFNDASKSQAIFYFSPNEGSWPMSTMQGFNSITAFTGHTYDANSVYHDLFLKMEFVSANTYRGWVSPDGISWVNVTGNVTRAVPDPSFVGFFVSSWGGTLPYAWSLRYLKIR